ncbi:MAG: TIGR00180 family glycosyltransferase [Gammaproteobacteria bacterium]
MLIEDDKAFSLIIPTYEGTPFLRRCLDHLKSVQYLGHVVLADDSTGEHREFVESCASRYPELWIDVHLYEHRTRFLDKLCQSMERIRARLVMLCGQDDFVVPSAVERVARALDADAGLACARGRIARFYIRGRDSGGANGVAVEFARYPMRAYREVRAVERVVGHIRAYSSTLYSVHRRPLLIESFRRTEAATNNVIFMQYLSSCITAAQGRIECVDALFLARQAHSASWAAQLMRDSEHWPLLVASPNFSAYYQAFRNALLELLRGEPDADGRLGERIDEAFVDLARHGLCRIGVEDPEHEAFHARLTTEGTEERREVDSIVRFALAHPETY